MGSIYRKGWLAVSLLTLSAVYANKAGAVPVPPTAIGPDVIAAWEKAGATLGWMGVDRWGRLAFRDDPEERQPDDLPAFQVHDWARGVVEKLPSPQVPFALSLEGLSLNGDDLRELTFHRRVQALDLANTLVGHVGLGWLLELAQIRMLDLTNTRITDRSLLVLGKLRQLETLSLRKRN